MSRGRSGRGQRPRRGQFFLPPPGVRSQVLVGGTATAHPDCRAADAASQLAQVFQWERRLRQRPDGQAQ